MCDSVGLDQALDELDMLSTFTRYKMEFLQNLEARFEERRAATAVLQEQPARPVWFQSRPPGGQMQEFHSRPLGGQIQEFNSTGRHQVPGLGMQQAQEQEVDSCWRSQGTDGPSMFQGAKSENGETSSVITASFIKNLTENLNVGVEPSSSSSFLHGGPSCSTSSSSSFLHGGPSCSTSSSSSSSQERSGCSTTSCHGETFGTSSLAPLQHPGPSRLEICIRNPEVRLDRNYVTNITIHRSQRFERIRARTQFASRLGVTSAPIGQYSSPYFTRIFTSPYPPLTSPYPPPRNNQVPPPGISGPPFRTTVKLSGVLTSFKHRTFKTRARVRFCTREESTEDLTRQLANIKLDLSSFERAPDPNRNSEAFTQIKPKEEDCSGVIRSLEYKPQLRSSPAELRSSQPELRARLMILEPRSRHMSLESADLSLHSDLTSSLNRLDLDEPLQ